MEENISEEYLCKTCKSSFRSREEAKNCENQKPFKIDFPVQSIFQFLHNKTKENEQKYGFREYLIIGKPLGPLGDTISRRLHWMTYDAKEITVYLKTKKVEVRNSRVSITPEGEIILQPGYRHIIKNEYTSQLSKKDIEKLCQEFNDVRKGIESVL